MKRFIIFGLILHVALGLTAATGYPKFPTYKPARTQQQIHVSSSATTTSFGGHYTPVSITPSMLSCSSQSAHMTSSNISAPNVSVVGAATPESLVNEEQLFSSTIHRAKPGGGTGDGGGSESGGEGTGVKGPIGDAVLPLLFMALCTCLYTFIKRKKGQKEVTSND